MLKSATKTGDDEKKKEDYAMEKLTDVLLQQIASQKRHYEEPKQGQQRRHKEQIASQERRYKEQLQVLKDFIRDENKMVIKNFQPHLPLQ